MDEKLKANAQAVMDEFWNITERKRHKEESDEKTPYTNQLKPDELHNWGTINNIKERSPFLKNLMEKVKLCAGDDPVRAWLSTDADPIATFTSIVTELGLEFQFIPMKTFKTTDGPQKFAVVLQVKTGICPNWSFQGLALSDQDARVVAAKNGIEFFIIMAS